jgi:hypothetical protein
MTQTASAAAASEVTPPIVITLGTASRPRIRQLKRGRGPLMDEVSEAVDQVRTSFGDEASGKVFVPVVLVYQRKTPRRLELWPWGIRI